MALWPAGSSEFLRLLDVPPRGLWGSSGVRALQTGMPTSFQEAPGPPHSAACQLRGPWTVSLGGLIPTMGIPLGVTPDGSREGVSDRLTHQGTPVKSENKTPKSCTVSEKPLPHTKALGSEEGPGGGLRRPLRGKKGARKAPSRLLGAVYYYISIRHNRVCKGTWRGSALRLLL